MEQQNSNEIEYYKIGIDLVKYEGQRLWQVFHLYLITEILLLGSFISTTNRLDTDMSFILGMAGLLLCIPWAGAYFRHSWWYFYRMEDTKKVEKNLKYNFLTIDREFGIFEKGFRPMYLTGFVILGISVIYLFLLCKLGIPCICLGFFSMVPSFIALCQIYLIVKMRKK